jgi:CheY-like chemotaxis protein
MSLKVEGTRLQLAMAEPTDQVLVSRIEFETGVRVAPMIALESSIKNAIQEARRAHMEGTHTIQPNVQRGCEPGAFPLRSEALEPPAPPSVGLPEEKERAIFETLGTPGLATETPPDHPEPVPGVEEMQTVLVAEHEPAVLKELETLLKSRRYQVVAARSGREVLNLVRDNAPDLVLIDGMLPDVHGFEICRQLKNSERFRHIPVVLVASVGLGWRFAADVKERYGADELVERPFDGPDLLRRIDLHLNRTPAGMAPDSEAAARKHLKDGVVALKQDRFEDAVTAFLRGLAIDQFHDLLHYYLAMAYEKLDRPFNAIDHYEKAVQLNPDFYDAIISLANLYQRQEFRRKAVEMWELALQATREETVRARIKEHLLSLL